MIPLYIFGGKFWGAFSVPEGQMAWMISLKKMFNVSTMLCIFKRYPYDNAFKLQIIWSTKVACTVVTVPPSTPNAATVEAARSWRWRATWRENIRQNGANDQCQRWRMGDTQGPTERLGQKAAVHYEVSIFIFIALHFKLARIFNELGHMSGELMS